MVGSTGPADDAKEVNEGKLNERLSILAANEELWQEVKALQGVMSVEEETPLAHAITRAQGSATVHIHKRWNAPSLTNIFQR